MFGFILQAESGLRTRGSEEIDHSMVTPWWAPADYKHEPNLSEADAAPPPPEARFRGLLSAGLDDRLSIASEAGAAPSAAKPKELMRQASCWSNIVVKL